METATTTVPTAVALLDEPGPEADELLARVMARVLAVLSEDDAPLGGLPTRQIRERVRGQQKGRLLEALWTLQEDGLLTVRPLVYRNRPGLLWTLTDPLVPLSEPRAGRQRR